MADTPRTASLIARAIVHLNFNEPDEATKALFEALTEINYPTQKETQHGNASAAA